MRPFKKLASPAIVALALAIAPLEAVRAVCVDGFLGNHTIECFDDVEELMDKLMQPDERSAVIRMVQPRGGQDTPMAAHNQTFNSCFFYAVAPILEYLGWSQFDAGSHFDSDLWYRTRTRFERFELDAGYQGSAEDLIGLYWTYETVQRTIIGDEGADIYPCGMFQGDPGMFASPCNPAGSPRLTLDTTPYACWDGGTYPIYQPGQQYGECQVLGGPTGDSFPNFLHTMRGGCGGPCDCSADADCGAYFFLNQTLPYYTDVGGVSDARDFFPTSSSDEQALRRIIKGFIDNDMPLLFSSNAGGHYMTMVGYARLDANGLPEIGIAADPVQQVYWMVDLKNWHAGQRFSAHGIIPWNQHLDRGCESGGWARELDRRTDIPDKFDLCPAHPDVYLTEAPRYYGAQITCQDGTRETEYHAYLDDPFIADERNLDCDRISLRYVDGDNHVTWARAYRYAYDAPRETWILASSYAPDGDIQVIGPYAGRSGPESTVVWDANWRDDYWMVASGLSGTYTERRTTLVLRLSDGSYRRVEIAPPETYGVIVECVDEDDPVREYVAEGNGGVFRVDRATHADQMVFTEGSDLRCDRVNLRVALGAGHTVTDAEIQRYYWTPSRDWRPANPVWAPDGPPPTVAANLSGRTLEFSWDGIWPNGNWLAATDRGSGASRGDRKTVIRLLDRSGRTVRQVEVVPE